MGAGRRRSPEKKVRRRSGRKESRRTADRRSRRGTASKPPSKRKRGGESRKPATIPAPVSGGAQAEGLGGNETVVYGLVAYEDWDREERDRLQRLLTGDLTDLRRAVEARVPGKPWTAVALGLACAAIAELRGSLGRSEEHTSELQSLRQLVCRLL